MPKEYSEEYSRTRYKKKSSRTQYNYLSPQEVRKLFNTIPSNNLRDIVIFKLMVLCGLRSSEIVGCNYSYKVNGPNGSKISVHSTLPGIFTKDFDFANRSLKVLGKGDKKRTVGLPDSLVITIQDYLMDFWDGETKMHIIQNQQDKVSISRRRVRAIFKSYCAKANLNMKTRVHDLRHTYAMRYLEKGGDVRDLMKAMGHTDLRTTMTYVYLIDEQERIERSRKLIEEEEPIEEF